MIFVGLSGLRVIFFRRYHVKGQSMSPEKLWKLSDSLSSKLHELFLSSAHKKYDVFNLDNQKDLKVFSNLQNSANLISTIGYYATNSDVARVKSILPLSVSMIPQLSVSQLLLLLDASFLVDLKDKKLYARAFNCFIFHTSKMTVNQALLLCFYIGYYGQTYEEISEALEEIFLKNFDQLSFSEISLFASSFFTSNYAIRNPQLLHMIEHSLYENITTHPLEMSVSAMKSLRHSRFSTSMFARSLDKFGNTGRDKLAASINSLAHLCQTMATLRVAHDGLLSKIVSNCLWNLKKRNFRTKDLAILMHSLFILRYPLPEQIAVEWTNEIRLRHYLIDMHRDYFLIGLIALAYHGYCPEDLLQRAIQFPNESVNRRTLRAIHDLYFSSPSAHVKCSNYSQKLAKKNLAIRRGLFSLWESLTKLLGKEFVSCQIMTPAEQIADIVLLVDNGKLQKQNYKVFTITKDPTSHEHELFFKHFLFKEQVFSEEELIYFETDRCKKTIVIRLFGRNQYLNDMKTWKGFAHLENTLLMKMNCDVLIVPPLIAESLAINHNVSSITSLILKKLKIDV